MTIASDGDVGRSIDAELRELHQRWCALHRWLRMTAVGPLRPSAMSAFAPLLEERQTLSGPDL
jgi:hypothetical protein